MAGLRAGTGYVDILPRIAKGFGADIEKGIKGDIDKAGSSAGSSIGGTLKKAALVAAGAFTIAGGIKVFSGFLSEAGESRKVAAQTAAAIASTGGAAKVSSKEIDALANSLSAKTGVDDEAIASGENLLLTFTNIRNEAGKGNDIFNQASSILTDMAAALGGDVSSNAIQLGKALNDPVAGISALTRVGVTFTQQQKDQIAAMVKAGDTAGAQKVILAELNKEFGGSAEAQATSGKKLSVVWGNIQEAIGGRLLPLFDRLAGWAAEKLPAALDWLSGAFNKIVAPIKAFIYTLTSGFTQDEGTPIERFALSIRENVFPVIEKIADFVKANLQPILIGLGAAILAFVVPPFLAWAAAEIAAIAPVVAVGLAIAALVAGVIYAYEHWAIFRTTVDAVVAFFRDTLVPIIGQVVAFVVEQFSHLAAYVEMIWPQISEAIGHVIAVIVTVVSAAIDLIMAGWRLFGDNILGIAKAIWDQIANVISTAIRIVRDVINFVLALINGDWGKAWSAISDIPKAALGFLVDMVKNALKIVGEVLSGAGKVIAAAASGMWDGITAAFKAAINWIIRAWNSIEFKIPGFSVGPVHFGGFTLGLPDIPLLGGGGLASGWFVAGDKGPELVHVGSTSRVLPNGETTEALGAKHYHLALNGVAYEPIDIAEQYRRMELLAG